MSLQNTEVLISTNILVQENIYERPGETRGLIYKTVRRIDVKRLREICFYLILFTLLTVTCCGFLLVTNVLIVSCFGQKCLLNVNVSSNDEDEPAGGVCVH